MRKHGLIVCMVALLLAMASVGAYASNIDLGLTNDAYWIDITLSTSPFTAVINVQETYTDKVIESIGDMTKLGDKLLTGDGVSYIDIAAGYRFGPVTPLIGWSTETVKKTEEIVQLDPISGNNHIVSKDVNERTSGMVYGVNVGVNIDQISLDSRMVVKPNGWYAQVKARYHISDIVAAHVGYMHHNSIDISTLVLGLGIRF